MRETTALGAAIAAGLASGVYKNLEELKEINRHDRTLFQPKIEAKEREVMYERWKKAVKMCKGWMDVDAAAADEVEGADGTGKEEDVGTERVEKSTSAGTLL